jgi:hypothetical protein
MRLPAESRATRLLRRLRQSLPPRLLPPLPPRPRGRLLQRIRDRGPMHRALAATPAVDGSGGLGTGLADVRDVWGDVCVCGGGGREGHVKLTDFGLARDVNEVNKVRRRVERAANGPRPLSLSLSLRHSWAGA